MRSETLWLLSCLMVAHVAAGPLRSADGAQKWDKGMDDDAGKASASVDVFTLPGAEVASQPDIYPISDRLYTTPLDGTWAFKLIEGLNVPESLKGWNTSGYNTFDWDDIKVPGNWELQGFSVPRYGNQPREQTGLYVRRFRYNPFWKGQRVFVRFEGVLFSYRVWVNGKEVGAWGSAYNPASFEITDALHEGRNTIAVEVKTRSKGWLFDTNDCWALAGIFRSVTIFTTPRVAAVSDIVFRTPETNRVEVAVSFVGAPSKVYVSLVDQDGLHVADSEEKVSAQSCVTHHASRIASPHLWTAEDPYLYDLVVTLVDAAGKKIQRVTEKVGVRTVELLNACSDKNDSDKKFGLLINGQRVFLNGVGWNETDPVEGRALSFETFREQMMLMKRAGVNCIRTAHYPFAPAFLRLADEMGFYVIDEVPFGSRGRTMLKDRKYKDELLGRTEATMRRDKNHPCVIFWTFGNENDFFDNTVDVLAYAKKKDPTRPRGLPQIGSSQFNVTVNHPERDVDFNAGHYLDAKRMEKAERETTKPMIQTEFAHACGNGFCDFEVRYQRMRARPDLWMGGCIWLWRDQAVMHSAWEIEECLSNRLDQTLPKDIRRDLPPEFQGNYIDDMRLIDSWGDRGTDGIVYGDGTPKDGYWLVKRMYNGKSKSEKGKSEEVRSKDFSISNLQPLTFDLQPPMLRIGRKVGMDQCIQSNRKRHASSQQPYLVAGEVQKDGKVRYYLSNPGKKKAWLEGTVQVTVDGDKTVVTYDLKPNDTAAKAMALEVGLAIETDEKFDRVDWIGKGPLTSVPGKNQMNDFGTWAMHKDDYRFIGPRSDVQTALVRANRGEDAVVLESGSGKVSFENVGGKIVLTECCFVAGYGGKGSPSSVKSFKDMTLKGTFKIFKAKAKIGGDVVPDLTYSQHYGF